MDPSYAPTDAAAKGEGDAADSPRPADEHGISERPLRGMDIDHYRVLRPIGEGGMGRVVLARDTRLGRLVALKLLHDAVDDDADPDALVAEARLMAKLSDPNVVQVHGLGLFEGQPYVAMEYIPGVNLRERLHQGDLSMGESARIAMEIARSLLAAEDAGIVHRDLKPENILLGNDGRVRVADFGIAAMKRGPLAPVLGEIVGTKGYMAPEQWRGGSPDSRTDIWALGVILFEMVARRHPLPMDLPWQELRRIVVDPSEPPLRLRCGVRPLEELVDAMLDRDPDGRPPPEQIVAALANHLAPYETDAPASPFKGLQPFQESDARWFFGRDREIEEIAGRLRNETLITLVGASGSGKSSLALAGVLPRLREQRPMRAVVMTPGGAPLQRLASRLAELAADDGERSARTRARSERLHDQLRANPRAANLLLHKHADRLGCRVVLVVDQVEETVTHKLPDAEIRTFLDAISQAADPIDDAVRVILTTRDDYLGKLAVSPSIRGALAKAFVVRRPSPARLEAAVLGPVRRAGYAWEDEATIVAMVRGLKSETAALPLLQFAVTELWKDGDAARRVVPLSRLKEAGGVAGMLASHADGLLATLTESEVAAARAIFLQLVGADRSRRVRPREEVLAVAGADGARVLKRLLAGRLVVSGRGATEAGDEGLIQIAHESLAQTWDTLRRWLDESDEALVRLEQVESAAMLWDSRGRRDEELWALDSVREAQRRLETVPQSEVVQRFIARGIEHGGNQARQRRRLVIGAIAALLLVTATSVTAALQFREQAEQINLAAADMGVFELRLQLFDWDPVEHRPQAADVADFPGLQVTFWDVDPKTGAALRPRDTRQIRRRPHGREGTEWRQAIETRSGPVILRIEGRGRAGRSCAASQLKLVAVPGYADRGDEPPPVRLRIPTCAVATKLSVAIDEGPFVYGGVGNPPIKAHVAPPAEATIALGPFRIDRTEVSNDIYAQFTTMAGWTGHDPPFYPPDDTVPAAAAPRHPVTGVTA